MAPGSGTHLRDKLEIDAFDMTCGRRDFGLFRRRELRVSPFEQKKFMSQRFGFPLCVACGTRQPAYPALPGTELGHTRSGLGLGPANMPAQGLRSVLCLANSDFNGGCVAPSGCGRRPQAHRHCPLRPALARPDTKHSKTQQDNIPASRLCHPSSVARLLPDIAYEGVAHQANGCVLGLAAPATNARPSSLSRSGPLSSGKHPAFMAYTIVRNSKSD
jgi:hypothetical protein